MNPTVSLNNPTSNIRPPKPANAPIKKREYTEQQHLAAIRIQALFRGWRTRRRHASEVKRARLRARVSNEILSTEQTYVRALDTIVDWYLTPIEKMKFFDKKDIDAIFLNVADIREFNHDLLDSLQQRIAQWSRDAALGDVFANKVKFDKYNFYCSNYDTAADRLAKLMKAKKVEQFLLVQRTASGLPLDLPSLLIMPVQRIPRYKLLLEELLKHTAETHPDYRSLNITLGQLKFIADLVNERIRDRQNRDAIAAVEKRVSGCPKLDKEGRVFLKEGKLMKICRKEPKPRLFFLFSDILIYASDDTLSIKFHLLVQLEVCAAEDVPDRPGLSNAFEILSKNKSFVVYAENADEKRQWLTVLQDAIKKRQKLISRDHSMGGIVAPVWVPDTQAKNCMLCTKEFSITQRRHHCRRCGRCVCNDCSTKRHKLNQDESPARICDKCFNELQGPVLQVSAAEPEPGPAPTDEDTVSKNLRRLTVVPNRTRSETDRKAPGPLAGAVLKAAARKSVAPSSSSESSSSPQSSSSAIAPLYADPSPPTTSASVSPQPSPNGSAIVPKQPMSSASGSLVTPKQHPPLVPSGSSGSLSTSRAPPRPAAPPPRPSTGPPSVRASVSEPDPPAAEPVVTVVEDVAPPEPTPAVVPVFVAPKRALPKPKAVEEARARAATANAAALQPAPAQPTPPKPMPPSLGPGAVAVLPVTPYGVAPPVPRRPPSATATATTTIAPRSMGSAPGGSAPPPNSYAPPAPSYPPPAYHTAPPPAQVYHKPPPPTSYQHPQPPPVEPAATPPAIAKGVAVLPVLAVLPNTVLNNTGGGKKLWAKPPPRPKEPPPP